MATAKKVIGGKVRYAVVGLGWISQAAFLPGVEHTGNSEVTAFVTADGLKAKEVGAKYDVAKTYTYEQYDEFLKSDAADAVYLATPNFDHVELAVKTLEAGLHLLLEKPMAVSVDECQRIIAASEKTGAKLMIAYRLHHEPGTLSAIQTLRDRKIGATRFFNSSFSQQIASENHRAKHGYWAGPVPDMGPYPINAVRNLFGEEPIEVYATGVQTDERFNFEDTVAVTLKFEKRVASFVLTYNGGDVDDFRVVGDKGDLFSDPAYQVGSGIEHVLTVEKKKLKESYKTTDHFGGELKYFSECILKNERPEADGEEGMLDVRILVAVEQSLKTNLPVKLAPYQRARRPMPGQVETLSKVQEPELVHAHKPSQGQ